MKTKSIFSATSITITTLIVGTVYNINLAQAQIYGANVNVNTSAQATPAVHASGTVMVNASLGTSGATSTSSGAGIVNVGSVNVGSASVGSMTSLDTYVQSMSSSNAAISSVNTSSDNQVSVEYKRPAKLFGFINTHVTETATVKVGADGTASATVHKSWWSIFASSDTKTDQFSTVLQSKLQNNANANAQANAQISDSVKAQYLADINAAAQATYTGSAY